MPPLGYTSGGEYKDCLLLLTSTSLPLIRQAHPTLNNIARKTFTFIFIKQEESQFTCQTAK